MGTLGMPLLYVVGFVTGTLAVVFDLSWNTLFVAVTRRERYVEAMSLLNGSRSLAYVAGPTIGGLLVQVLGAPLAMFADALSYLGSVVFLRRIRSIEPPIETDMEPIRERLVAGLAFVLGDPLIRPSMLAIATINLFNFSFAALFILYATTTLGVSPGALGLALGVGAIGGLLGAVIASRVGRRLGLGPAYALGCIIFPVSLILVPIADPDMPMAVILGLILVSEFGAGLGVMILDINIGAINNARIPDPIRARANGAYRFINYGVRPIGALFGGLLGAAIGVREALFVVTIAASLGVAVDDRLTGPASARPAGRSDLAAGLARPTPSGRCGSPARRRPRPRRRGRRTVAQRRRRPTRAPGGRHRPARPLAEPRPGRRAGRAGATRAG